MFRGQSTFWMDQSGVQGSKYVLVKPIVIRFGLIKGGFFLCILFLKLMRVRASKKEDEEKMIGEDFEVESMTMKAESTTVKEEVPDVIPKKDVFKVLVTRRLMWSVNWMCAPSWFVVVYKRSCMRRL